MEPIKPHVLMNFKEFLRNAISNSEIEWLLSEAQSFFDSWAHFPFDMKCSKAILCATSFVDGEFFCRRHGSSAVGCLKRKCKNTQSKHTFSISRNLATRLELICWYLFLHGVRVVLLHP